MHDVLETDDDWRWKGMLTSLPLSSSSPSMSIFVSFFETTLSEAAAFLLVMVAVIKVGLYAALVVSPECPLSIRITTSNSDRCLCVSGLGGEAKPPNFRLFYTR